MKKIPLIIRTKNRLQYLYYTLNSLYATNATNLCDIYISDDCSDNKSSIQFLTTNNKINYNFNFFTDNKFRNYRNILIRDFNQLNPITQLNGIKDKVNIWISDTPKGVRGGILYNIKKSFQMFEDAPFVIFVQADVLFNKNWLNKVLQIYQKQKDNLGVISCWNLHQNYLNNSDKRDDYLLLNKNQGTGFPTVLLTRNIYNVFMKQPQVFEKKWLDPLSSNDRSDAFFVKNDYNIAGDHFVLQRCWKNNLKVISTQRSYVQHIGIGSTSRKWQVCWYRSTLFENPFQYKRVF